MKIAFIPGAFNTIDMDATHLTLRELGSNLKKEREDVYVITVSEKGDKTLEIIDGIEVHRTRKMPKTPNAKNPFSYISWALANIKQYSLAAKDFSRKKSDIDIINGISASPFLALRTISAKKYFNKAKTVHNIKGRSRFFIGDLFSFLLNWLDAVVVPTNMLKRRLMSFGCGEKKIKIIKSPIDLNKFKPRNKEEMKRKYGFSGKIVMYYGHLNDVKGIDYLIKAIKILKDEEITFLFVTPSVKKFYKPYLAKIKKNGIDNKIKVITKKVKIEEFVNLADVVVLPYPKLISTEGNPSCLLECMASKTPVITTSLSELKEIVEDEKDVIMVKPKNPKEISSAILKLINDKNLQEKLADNAYKKSKQFDIKTITKKYQELYRGLTK